MTKNEIKARLAYLRKEIEQERISYAEIAELQGLAEHIDNGDTLLLQWAGVPEFEELKFSQAEIEQLEKLLKKLIDYLDMDNMTALAHAQGLLESIETI